MTSHRYLIPNPAWVTKHLADSWVNLENTIPAAWMPKLDRTKAAGNKFTGRLSEYGCGAYGCVFPTLDKEVVLKVTTDSTEAQFAAQLAKTLPIPVVTRYDIVMLLPDAKRQKRKVYLLWRESAEDVGQVDTIVGVKAEDTINRQHAAAQRAYECLHDGEPAVRELRTWRSTVEDLATIPELHYLATGMLAAYDQQGIFFGDIHGGNIGRCKRGSVMEWVITDPGHIAVVQAEKAATMPAATSRRRTSEVATHKKNPPKDPDYHRRRPGETLAEFTLRRNREHNEIMADETRWKSMTYLAIQEHDPDFPIDDDDNPDIELRDCPCGQTMGRVMRQFPKTNPFGVGAAFTVDEAARRVPREQRFGERKVFISDVYDQLVDDRMNNDMNLAEFKEELARLQQDRNVTLARADLVAALDPKKVQRSETRRGPAQFHFIVLDDD